MSEQDHLDTIARAICLNPDFPWERFPDSAKKYYRMQARAAIAAIAPASDELTNAAREVIKSFHAVGADKSGLVVWTIDPIAMRRLMIAIGPFDWNEVY